MPLRNHQNGKKVGAVLVAGLILGSSVVQTNLVQNKIKALKLTSLLKVHKVAK